MITLKKGTPVFLFPPANANARSYDMGFIYSEYNVEYEDREVKTTRNGEYFLNYQKPYPLYKGRRVARISWFNI